MCWNREVSLVTGTTAVALSSYLLVYGKGNDIPVALVSLGIALMQFAEALMWDQLETGQEGAGGQLGLLALFLQPLLLGLGIWWTSGADWRLAAAFVAVWGICALPTLLPLLRQRWPVAAGSCGHLQWSFLQPMLSSPFAALYWPIMLAGWLLLRPFSEGAGYALTAVGTLGITWWWYPGEWGTLWCFLANALPLGRILWY